MRKVLNSRLFIFLLGGLTFTSITIAAYQYQAIDVTYTPKNNNWKVNNVKSAIEDLKKTNDTTIAELNNKLDTYANLDKNTDFEASDLVSGKHAYKSDGTYVTGTLVKNREMELLWENQYPLSAFSARTISLNLSKYKYVVISATYGGNGLLNDYYADHKSIIPVGTTNIISGIYHSADGGAATVRKVTVTTTGVTFYAGKFWDSANKISDNYAVPLKIWGIE